MSRDIKKYWFVARSMWDEMLTYRLNFTMWRVRNVLQLLTVYFLWFSLIPTSSKFGGYDQSQIITYILGTSIVGAIVFSTRTGTIGDQINNGDLSKSFLSVTDRSSPEYHYLYLLGSRMRLLAGYTLWQMIIFFLTFNLVDTLTQLSLGKFIVLEAMSSQEILIISF